jgi:DNA invertase Pin-like site-specific DNA recombinase
VYLRISQDRDGDGLAIERQQEDCLRIIKERGWTLVDTFTDQSKSAYSKTVKRPEYDRMVRDYNAGRFDAIVCWDLDRLTRQPRQLEDWIDAAEERGLVVVTANGEADLSTDGGRMYARVKAAVARSESERKAARQRRAAQQRADQGRPPKGVRLTGYELDGTVIRSEAAIIKKVFARFLAGEPLLSIARWLEDSGVPTRRGGRWNPSSVRTILMNPRYAGLSTYAPNPTKGGTRERAVVADGVWKPLVSRDDFDIVQSRLNDPRRKTNRVGTARKHLGSGLYVCDACSERMSSWSGGRYCCRNCGMTRSMPQVDEVVELVVSERLADPRIVEAVTPVSSDEIEVLRVAAAAARSRLTRIEEDYDSGLIDGPRFASASAKAKAELDGILAKQAAASGSSALASVLGAKDPVAVFKGGSLELRRALVDALVEVRLRRAPQGVKAFASESVVVSPKGASTNPQTA